MSVCAEKDGLVITVQCKVRSCLNLVSLRFDNTVLCVLNSL